MGASETGIWVWTVKRPRRANCHRACVSSLRPYISVHDYWFSSSPSKLRTFKCKSLSVILSKCLLSHPRHWLKETKLMVYWERLLAISYKTVTRCQFVIVTGEPCCSQAYQKMNKNIDVGKDILGWFGSICHKTLTCPRDPVVYALYCAVCNRAWRAQWLGFKPQPRRVLPKNYFK